MMVPIMILAALAIDIGAMHADKQQLQAGADAGALAIAQDCARDDCGSTIAQDTAEAMAAANFNAAGAEGGLSSFDPATGEVTVETSTTREHWFAPIIGIDSSPIRVQSSARWGYPTGGTAVMPLTFSWCELEGQEGVTVLRDSEGNVTGVDIPEATPDAVLYNKGSEKNQACPGTSGSIGSSESPLPGGFGWLTPGASCGETESVIDGWVGSDTGNNVPSGCAPEDFSKWVGKTVLLPIFDKTTGTGSGGEYQIFGYAAFTVSGYDFAGSYRNNSPCSGSDRCISGSFDRFVDLTDAFDYSPEGPRMGAAVVALTLTE
ncbi:hypothetical protein H4W27_002294 [Nesterenkonia lutea]|uniref:Putative Flp pilus-assembly TadG-like N-terminal domain-containing protein n=2 Tax=Nesterenkonia lutea TaxID=272919 RepID=A0ABR9JH70_9MICC|nr:hypothetical protein [Nesterenkonia lutea]